MRRMAIVGVGLLGTAVASRLLTAGFEVRGYDTRPEPLGALAAQGLVPAASLAEAVVAADAVITILPTPAVVESVWLDAGGLLETAPPAATLLQMSTVSPALVTRLGAAAGERRRRFLEQLRVGHARVVLGARIVPFRRPEGAGEEPEMQVRRAVAPPIHVDPGNAVERSDGALKPDRHDAQLRGQQIRQVPEVQMGPTLQDQDDRKAGRAVHGTDAPPIIDPDVRVVGRIAGDAIGGIFAASLRFDLDRRSESLDPHVALEGERRPASEVRQGHGVLGHVADPSAGHRPLSRVNFSRCCRRPVNLSDKPRRRPKITACGQRGTQKVIHRSYPQARLFHVKHDVERVNALWIHQWTSRCG